MQINLTPDDVDTLVKDTILKAGIGKVITDAVARTLGASYNNPIDDALKRYIGTVVGQLLETDFKVQVDAAVRAAIEERLTAPIMQKMSEAAIQKIVKAAEDSY